MKLTLTAFLSALIALPAAAQTVPEAPPMDVKSYVLMDYQTGQVLAAKDGDARVEPASITKVMTTYVAFDEIAKGRVNMDDAVLISEKAWREGIDSSQSRMFIEVGSKVPVHALLRGIIIASGNDASLALAEHLGGSVGAFASLMNSEAQRLGLKDTHYMNASGLPDPEHYTSAHDIARLVRALIRDFPDGYAIYAEKEFTWNNIRQFNRNKLLWRDDSVDGVKTGHTSSAGYCLSASAVRDGRRLIAVVMGDKSEEQRAVDTLALLNYGFRFFETVQLYGASDPVQTLPAYKGTESELAVGPAQALAVSIPRGAREQLQVQAQVQQPVIAPIQAGQTMGTIEVSLAGKTLISEPLVALKAVPEGGLWRRLVDSVRLRFFN